MKFRAAEIKLTGSVSIQYTHVYVYVVMYVILSFCIYSSQEHRPDVQSAQLKPQAVIATAKLLEGLCLSTHHFWQHVGRKALKLLPGLMDFLMIQNMSSVMLCCWSFAEMY